MAYSVYGFTLTLDLHGMTVNEAKKELQTVISTCPKQIREIEVIHGYTKGQALQTFVRREFTHPKIERKIIGMNNGATTLIIKKN